MSQKVPVSGKTAATLVHAIAVFIMVVSTLFVGLTISNGGIIAPGFILIMLLYFIFGSLFFYLLIRVVCTTHSMVASLAEAHNKSLFNSTPEVDSMEPKDNKQEPGL